MTPAGGSSPGRPRHSLYAQPLFDGKRPRRAAAVRGKREGRRPGPPPPRIPTREDRLRALLPLLAIPLFLGIVFNLGALQADADSEQHPDPARYRDLVDLVSIDRVGTMFCATVSQGFFLEPTDAQRRHVERLVDRVQAEGYGSLYLFEASGRTVASWNGAGLQLLPPASSGS